MIGTWKGTDALRQLNKKLEQISESQLTGNERQLFEAINLLTEAVEDMQQTSIPTQSI